MKKYLHPGFYMAGIESPESEMGWEAHEIGCDFADELEYQEDSALWCATRRHLILSRLEWVVDENTFVEIDREVDEAQAEVGGSLGIYYHDIIHPEALARILRYASW